ncbi:hypothetical protein V8E55_009908 [Tylopilus felleus]
MKSLYLVHPWLDSLLEHEHTSSSAYAEDDVAPPPSVYTDDEEISDDESEDGFDDEFDESSSEESIPEPSSQPTPRLPVPVDRETRVRRLAVHLRQPFGALVLALASMSRRMPDYRRIAADCLITVQFQENVSLGDILDNVRTLDVL